MPVGPFPDPDFLNGDSVEEQILENMRETLEYIQLANGFQFDMEKAVRFRVAGWGAGVYPIAMIVGVRTDKKQLEGDPPRRECTMSFIIEVIATRNPAEDAETLHRMIMMNVETALDLDETRGGVARDTEILGGTFAVVEDPQPYAVSILNGRVRFQHHVGDPTVPS